MSQSGAGISVTLVSTDQQCPLGFVLKLPATSGGHDRADRGEQEWVYVFNDDPANAFALGTAVYRDPSAATEDYFGATITPVTVHQPKISVIGVAQHAIAVGSYGFVLRKGVGSVLAGSGAVLSADTAATTGGAEVGSLLEYADGTANENIAVIAFPIAEIAASATGLAVIDCGW